MQQKQTGVISAWFEDRGFGFIHEIVNGNLKSHFLHISKIISGVPAKGAECVFNTGTNTKGEVAIDVEVQVGGAV